MVEKTLSPLEQILYDPARIEVSAETSEHLASEVCSWFEMTASSVNHIAMLKVKPYFLFSPIHKGLKDSLNFYSL